MVPTLGVHFYFLSTLSAIQAPKKAGGKTVTIVMMNSNGMRL
jgi:hypothetical protein